MSAPAEIILGDLGSTSVSVASTDGQSVVVTPVGATSVSVGAAESQSISVTSTTTEVSVSSPDVQSISVSTSAPSIEVSSNVNPVTWPQNFRDLGDIVGTPSSGQVLVYNEGENNFQFQDQESSDGGGGNELTDYAITVTNTDGAFSTISGSTYEASTSFTDILKDILNPYTKTSVQLTKIQGTKEGSALAVSSGSVEVLEVGASVSLLDFSFTVGDEDKIEDGSVKLLKSGSPHMSSLSESGGTDVSISPIINSQKNTPGKDVYKITAVDSGNPNNQEYDLSSSSITLDWRHRIGLFAYSSNPTDNITATTLFGNGIDARLLNDPGSSSVAFTCGASNASDSNYTYLMWPTSFGTLKSVDQNGSADVTADFSLMGSYTITNSYSVSTSYYIYGTNDTGAFNENVVLNVTLQDA